MALTKCRECSKEVSAKAAACPHCGHPLKVSADTRARLFKVIGGLCMAVGMVASMAEAAGATKASWGFGLLAAGFVLFIVGRAFQ